ncbi:MAG TPA: GDCCVxC domain-containing (seleno)protein [Pyrinomonadaceae bacterium]|nr:GDCCVxC domain-containing (seleno)protein [Pyrinomonadaceae bacterium]
MNPFESTLTCPKCGYRKLEVMPTDQCMFFYQCGNCRTVIKPLEGDCCVFCSYGSAECCPPKMAE